MENKLPEDLQNEIANKAAAYADQAHANDGDDIHIGYLDGAAAYAQWKIKYDELCERFKSQDQEMFSIQQQYQQLKDKYDNILATEDGHLSATENVWQSGYAAGHEAGRERGTNELIQENERLKKELDVAIRANENLISRMGSWQQQLYGVQKERDALKEHCDKMEAALIKLNMEIDKTWNECNTKSIPDKYKKAINSAQAMCNEALKEGESKLTQQRADFIREVNNRDLPESNTPAPVQGEKEVERCPVFVPCTEDDPDCCGGYTSNDGRSLCYVKEVLVPLSSFTNLH
jgi:chromosome segregation ATPase